MALSSANMLLVRTHEPTMRLCFDAVMDLVRNNTTPTLDAVKQKVLGTSTDDRNIGTACGLLITMIDEVT